MATNITFRKTDSALNKPSTTTVKGAPLTSLEIDGNFKSIKDNLDEMIVGGVGKLVQRHDVVSLGGQTIFDLPFSYTPGMDALMVFVNGVLGVAGSRYTETSSTRITMTPALVLGDRVTVMVNVSPINNLPYNPVDGRKDLFVAGTNYTKNTTTSLTLSNTPAKSGTVKVFFDGIYQNKDTYYIVGNVVYFGAVGSLVAIPSDTVEVQYEIPSEFVGLSVSDNDVLTAAQNVAINNANAAAASFNSFDDRYLGAKSVAPTLDNDGNALLVGAKYFNSTESKMYVRNASNAWQLDTADSSTVNYDEGTVQDVLDSAKPITDYTALRAYTGRATSIRITTPGIAGFFRRNGSAADNGGTVIVDGNGRSWERVFDGAVNVKWFGAKGDGIVDDTVAIQAAINTGNEAQLPYSNNGYRTTVSITIGTGQKLIGIGPRPKLLIDHAGAGISITNKGHVENISIDGTTTFRGVYTGVLVGPSGGYNTHGIIENVFVFYPSIGFHLNGGAYWYTVNNVDVYRFKDYGILLSSGANNNNIHFKQLASTATEITPGSATYNWDAITWEQAAIKVMGNQNIFTGGEPAPSKWGVIVGDLYTSNRFVSMYMEHQYCVLKAGKGSETYWDASGYGGIMEIDPDAIVVGPSGNIYGVNTPLGTTPIAAGKNVKAIWLFNEGYGSTVYDQSGNGKNLTLAGASSPDWGGAGRWGNVAQFDVAQSKYINNIPLDSVDWAMPFTFIACMKVPESPTDNWAIVFTAGARYAGISVTPSYLSYVDYDGSTVASVSFGGMRRSDQDGYLWVTLYFDPVNKTISSLSPVSGLVENISDADSPRFAPWTTGGGAGISSVALGRRYSTGFNGSFSFVGLWQRRLTFSEVNDLVNMRVPNLWPSAAPVKLTAQSNSVAADIATLRADFNSLLEKMRIAGLLKT